MFTRRPAPWCLISTGHGTMIVNRNDYRMTGADAGYGVGYQLMTTNWFDPEEASLLVSLFAKRRKHFGAGALAIDVGANIGTLTVELSKASYGWGEVVAFEAQRRIAYALAGNVAINNCGNATVHHAAVGRERGSITVPIPDYGRPSSFGSLELRPRAATEDIGQPIDYTSGEDVDQVAIDDFGFLRVDLIKIDVEGMEFDVLAGAQETIEASRPILLIEHIKVDAAELVRTLEGLGYVVIPVAINLLAIHQSDPCLKEIGSQ